MPCLGGEVFQIAKLNPSVALAEGVNVIYIA